MLIHITEHKSQGTLHPLDSVVRVFVDHDYHYGYWVPEHALFAQLTPEQQQVYLQGSDAKLDVTPAVAQHLIDIGTTPFAKRQVA